MLTFSHWRRDHGTVLLLFPAAVFVVLILGAFALDLGLAQVRRRQLDAVAASAANDTLQVVDVAALRTDGSLVIDPAEARAAVAESIAAGPLPDAVIESVVVDASGPNVEVEVELSLAVDFVIAPAIPGSIDQVTVRARESVLILE